MPKIPAMPRVRKRRPYGPMAYTGKILQGYEESLDDWVDNNQPAVEWFLEHHETVRAAMKLLKAQRKPTPKA